MNNITCFGCKRNFNNNKDYKLHLRADTDCEVLYRLHSLKKNIHKTVFNIDNLHINYNDCLENYKPNDIYEYTEEHFKKNEEYLEELLLDDVAALIPYQLLLVMILKEYYDDYDTDKRPILSTVYDRTMFIRKNGKWIKDEEDYITKKIIEPMIEMFKKKYLILQHELSTKLLNGTAGEMDDLILEKLQANSIDLVRKETIPYTINDLRKFYFVERKEKTDVDLAQSEYYVMDNVLYVPMDNDVNG